MDNYKFDISKAESSLLWFHPSRLAFIFSSKSGMNVSISNVSSTSGAWVGRIGERNFLNGKRSVRMNGLLSLGGIPGDLGISILHVLIRGFQADRPSTLASSKDSDAPVLCCHIKMVYQFIFSLVRSTLFRQGIVLERIWQDLLF